MSGQRHHEHDEIGPLTDELRVAWDRTVPDVGEITAYHTQAGVVIFLDFERGGWTMFTEVASIKVADNAAALRAMMRGSR